MSPLYSTKSNMNISPIYEAGPSVLVVGPSGCVADGVCGEDITYLSPEAFCELPLSETPSVFYFPGKHTNSQRLSELVTYRRDRLGDEDNLGVYYVRTGECSEPPSPALPVIVAHPEELATVLRTKHRARIMALTAATVQGPRTTFKMEIVLSVGPRGISSFQKACDYVREQLTDHMSGLRQDLANTYHVPNVQVVAISRTHQSMRTGDVTCHTLTLECTPSDVARLRQLNANRKQIAQLARNEISKHRGSHFFEGTVSVNVSDSELRQLLVDSDTDNNNNDPSLQCDGSGPSISSLLENDGRRAKNKKNKRQSHNRDHHEPTNNQCIADLKTLLNNTNLSRKTITEFLGKHRSSLSSARSEQGYNALHCVVEARQANLLSSFVFTNLWESFHTDTIQTTSSVTLDRQRGFTPRRLAESQTGGDQGSEFLEEYDRWATIHRSLPNITCLVLTGNTELVSELLRLTPDLVHDRSEQDYTPLLAACATGNEDMVRLLLTVKADVNCVTSDNESCLHLACQYGHSRLLPVLTQTNVNITLEDSHGLTASDYAAINGDLEALMHLKDATELKHTILPLSAKHRHMQLVTFALEQCHIDVDGLDASGKSALCYAIINDDVPMTTLLLKHNKNLSLCDNEGLNVLHLAAKYGSEGALGELCQSVSSDILRSLVRQTDVFSGRDLLKVVRGRDKRRRAWHWLQIQRHLISAFTTKLNTGQIDVARFGKIHACGFGLGPDTPNKQKVEKMLEKRVAEKSADQSPLHHAVRSSSEDLVRRLLDLGADPNQADHFGLTLLHVAAGRGDMGILRLLEQHGAQADPHTEPTPVNIATENGHVAAANFLNTQHTLQIAEGFVSQLRAAKLNLSESFLQEQRAKGQDIRRHLIHSLRELTIDINAVLMELGSCPVMEPTDSSARSGPS